MSPVYRTPNFEFFYEVIGRDIHLDFLVLDPNERDLVQNGDYSSGAELIDENFGYGAVNPCFFNGTPLDLSEHVKRLEKVKTTGEMNNILINVYWELKSLVDDYC